MKAWSERPFEVAHLVNPAFTGILLREFAGQFERSSGEPPEVLLVFLAIPLVLHDATRDRLPPTKVTKHHVWLEENPDLRVGFAGRCRAVAPHVREAIVFSVAAGWISLAKPTSLRAERRVRKSRWLSRGRNAAHLKAAGFIGRWFAGAGSVSTVYAHWGVRP